METNRVIHHLVNVSSAGVEPAFLPSEGSILSIERRGQTNERGTLVRYLNP